MSRCPQGLRIKNKEEWAVKSILEKSLDDAGDLLYLVEWEGNWAPTWEPHDVLENAQTKIDEFLAKENDQNKNKKGRKRKRKNRD